MKAWQGWVCFGVLLVISLLSLYFAREARNNAGKLLNK